VTDDQGYGDLSVHGNPVLETPKLDALHAESVRFTDFHVAPMCTPTRGELMTGIDAFRNGATAVCEGRSLPRRELKMMPQYFKDSGYATGHFGKWHLGDNYPYRPQDRGFDDSIHNCAWGIGSLAEHWGNDAFDDQYWCNGEIKRYPGYNTDVFFGQAMNWIEKQERPFFLYLPTTAAHSPFVVPEKYARPYKGKVGPTEASFFGMIANIDENVAKLDRFLEQKGLRENTIFIFMSDNGTVKGQTVFNAGMRGKKTSAYDGGHRVPFFLRWPAGGYDRGRDVNALAHGTDLLPTVIDLCGLKNDNGKAPFDGRSLRPLLEGKENALDDRKVVIQYRAHFSRWRGAVLWKKWRLVNGRELHDVATDPGQVKNLYEQRPEVVEAMRTHYEEWTRGTTPIMGKTNYVSVGTPHEETTWLSSCNWTGSYADNWGNLARQDVPGHWSLQVESEGVYRVSIYMFHPAANGLLNGSVTKPSSGGRARPIKARPVAQARLVVDGKAITVETAPKDTHVTFELSLKKGQRVKLEGQFLDRAGKILCGAFYTFVQKTDENGVASSVQEYVSAGEGQASDRPNVIFIFIDDMGYGDVGPFGNKVNRTPCLDRMADEGLKLTQFYVSNTACTPSRSALMTGTYAHRIGMDGRVVFPGEKRGLHPDEITIAELVKDQGYATGCFGKWHLGDQSKFMPLAQGFDEYFGIPYSNDMWPGNKRGNPVTNRGPYTPLPIVRQNAAVAYVSDGTDQSLLCEVITDEAVKFIKAHQDEPFFCYLPHAYVHRPRYARPAIHAKAGGSVSRSNVEEVDTSVGRILDILRQLGIEKNTLVVFTSDNGGAGGMSMGPLRGGKGGPKYEGHMRVPTITWWPGTIPAGKVSHEIAATIDVLPSLARLTGAKMPDDRIIDGRDALDVLLGKPGAKSPHETLYYEVDGIRRGKWKLVAGFRRKPELFDLEADLGERTNLAAKHPDRVTELKAALAKHAASIAAHQRPAGMVDQAKPIISKPGDLPRLREFMGMPEVRATDDNLYSGSAPGSD